MPELEGPRLACDVGAVRIGIAVGDAHGVLASPRDAIPAGDGTFDEVLAIAHEVGAIEIVVGLPVSLDGSRGPAAQQVESWVRELKQRTSIPVVTVDERLTTVEAQRRLRSSGRTTRQTRSIIDSAAATVLLEHYLDRLRGGSST